MKIKLKKLHRPLGLVETGKEKDSPWISPETLEKCVVTEESETKTPLILFSINTGDSTLDDVIREMLLNGREIYRTIDSDGIVRVTHEYIEDSGVVTTISSVLLQGVYYVQEVTQTSNRPSLDLHSNRRFNYYPVETTRTFNITPSTPPDRTYSSGELSVGSSDNMAQGVDLPSAWRQNFSSYVNLPFPG